MIEQTQSPPVSTKSPPEPSVHTRIRPPRTGIYLELGEIWQYRELILILVWRDIKVRYKQTALGATWAVLQPVLTMVVFSIIFGRLAGIPSDGIPYPVFTYVALLPWQLFAHAVNESANSLVNNQQLVTKVYFPRLVIPLAAVLGGLADFFVAFAVLLCLMFFYGITVTLAILTIPLFLFLAVTTAFAVGLWLSALNVEYRDVRYTIPFLTQFWLFATPIAYSSNLIPEQWRLLYALNPMVGVVEGFRWALLGREGAGPLVLVSVITALTLLISGIFYFQRMEDSFADKV